VYVLLKRILRCPGLPIEGIHEAWSRVPREDYYPKEEELFTTALENWSGVEIPLHVRRVLFRVLDNEKRSLATAWLSGNESLTQKDYERLGVMGPLGDQDLADVLKCLGFLSIDAGPIVLVLDQLDGLRESEQVGEVESLLIDLQGGGKNWYVIISLLHEKFNFWNTILSDPFKGRFGRMDGTGTYLKVSELHPLTSEQARELLSIRLLSPELKAQRQQQGVIDPCHPLTREDVEKLVELSYPATSARALLQKAASNYVEVVSKIRPSGKPLADFLKSTLADIRGRLSGDDLGIDTNIIASRISELFDLVARRYTGSELKIEKGPLLNDMRSFRGSDLIYGCNDRKLRVVGHDVQQGRSFPSVLERIVNSPSNTILVRDARIRASGTRTKELLDQFQQDKSFVHLPLEEIESLHALGSLLAKMREGDFMHEETDPKPTSENILKCLAGHKDLEDMTLAREFVRCAGLGQDASTKKEKKEEECQPKPAPPDAIVQMVTKLMEQERWLSFDRLCFRVLTNHVRASHPQIYDCLRTDPVLNKVTLYPTDFNPLEAPAIIVWTAEG